jgi:hypothetical protein
MNYNGSGNFKGLSLEPLYGDISSLRAEETAVRAVALLPLGGKP